LKVFQLASYGYIEHCLSPQKYFLTKFLAGRGTIT
jgi:hypothetical protein